MFDKCMYDIKINIAYLGSLLVIRHFVVQLLKESLMYLLISMSLKSDRHLT